VTDPSEAWWRGAVIYQIYPPSFADGNGDGIGDLEGMAARLPHVASLGVDAVWLNPIYPSGGVDGGYDITDQTDVDPAYGGVRAFETFRDAAHRLGLRVLLDFVPSHTSDRHPWFEESRASRSSAKRSWYVWADGRDGGPPNNWISAFGGPAWVWDEATEQFYLASFYPQQPDLDWHEPAVRDAMCDVLRVWVERGVDGFRIDALQRVAKDPELRDNPPAGPNLRVPDNVRAEQGAWFSFEHVYDQMRPELHEHIRSMRRTVGADRPLIGEVWMFEPEVVGSYLRPEELDVAFDFPFALTPWDARLKAEVVDEGEQARPPGSLVAMHLSSHDIGRIASRAGERAVRPGAVVLLTLPGVPVVYQGEEIGMAEGVVAEERRRDRMGRDGCRTPMQWDSSPNAGFCPRGVDPWLPVAEGFERRNVAVEEEEADSVLALYRRALRLRRSSTALRFGSYLRVEAPADVLVYVRENAPERVLVAVNFASRPVPLDVPHGDVLLATDRSMEGAETGGSLTLPADGAVVIGVR
jgi:alpha-glucosidase